MLCNTYYFKVVDLYATLQLLQICYKFKKAIKGTKHDTGKKRRNIT